MHVTWACSAQALRTVPAGKTSELNVQARGCLPGPQQEVDMVPDFLSKVESAAAREELVPIPGSPTTDVPHHRSPTMTALSLSPTWSTSLLFWKVPWPVLGSPVAIFVSHTRSCPGLLPLCHELLISLPVPPTCCLALPLSIAHLSCPPHPVPVPEFQLCGVSEESLACSSPRN